MNSFSNQHVADSLLKAESYFHASIAYEELIFTNQQSGLNNYYRHQKAICYKELSHYQKAIDELKGIYFRNASDSLYLHVNYQLALCYFLMNEPQQALWKIDEFLFTTHDTILFSSFLPLKALCHNELQEWNKASDALILFSKYQLVDEETKQDFRVKVESIYNKKNLPRIIPEKRAQYLSRFIPGAGQIYAGEVGEGVLNLLIHLSLLTFSAHQFSNGFTTFQFWNGYFVTGYFAGLGMFHKVYQGGIKRAGLLASQNNKNETAAFNHTINKLVIDHLD